MFETRSQVHNLNTRTNRKLDVRDVKDDNLSLQQFKSELKSLLFLEFIEDQKYYLGFILVLLNSYCFYTPLVVHIN